MSGADVRRAGCVSGLHSGWYIAGVMAVAFTSASVYSGTFGAGYVWDDRAAIVGNPDVTGVNPWWQLFEHDFWGQHIDASDSHKSFRPITTATFRLQYYISAGKLAESAASMHQANVALHALVAIAICALGPTVGLHPVASLVAALLFGVHPVHVDAVASLVGRAELLSCLLFVAALMVYHTSQQAMVLDGKLALINTRVYGSLTVFSVLLCVAATLLACAAALCKEIGITAFAVFIAMEALADDKVHPSSSGMTSDMSSVVKEDEDEDEDDGQSAIASPSSSSPLPSLTLTKKARQRQRQRARRQGLVSGDATPRSAQGSDSAHWLLGGLFRREALIRLALSASLVVIFLYWRLARHADAPGYRWRPLENRLAHLPRSLALLMSTAHTHARSLGLLFWPRVLSFDHGLGCHPLVLSIADHRNFETLAAYATLVGMFIAAITLRRRPTVLGLAVFVASYAPAANIFVFVGLEVAERVLYIPSLGLAIALVDIVPAVADAVLDGTVTTALRALIGCDRTAIPHLVGSTHAEITLEDSASTKANMSPARRSCVCGGTASAVLWACVGVLIAAPLSIRTAQYVPAWTDEEALFKAGVEACPRGVKAGNNLAYHWTSKPDPHPLRNQTEGLLRSAIAVWRHHSSAYLNLALLWSKTGIPPSPAPASTGEEAQPCGAMSWACGPSQIDQAATTARKLGADTGDEAAIGLLWASLASLHQTPAPAFAWLARVYLTKAASRDLDPLPFSPEAATRALTVGMPLGSLRRPPGTSLVALTERDTELGAGAMQIWISRFVIGSDRHASTVLVKEGTPLDHGIVTGAGFGWLSRHQLPYPPAYSPAASEKIRNEVSTARLGLRLIEEATDAGAAGLDVFRWRTIAAAAAGEMGAAVLEARRCLDAWNRESGTQGSVYASTGSSLVPGAGSAPDAGIRTSCELLLAGALLEEAAGYAGTDAVASVPAYRQEAIAILERSLATTDAASLSNLGGEVRQYGMAELSVEVTRMGLERGQGSEQETAIANNHGYALELAGRPGMAVPVYEQAMRVGAEAVVPVLRANLARATGSFQQARSYQQALQKQAHQAAMEVNSDGTAV